MDDKTPEANVPEVPTKTLIHQNIGMLNTTRRTLEGAHQRLMLEYEAYEHSPAYLKMQIALADLSAALKRLESAEDEISLLRNSLSMQILQQKLHPEKVFIVDKL